MKLRRRSLLMALPALPLPGAALALTMRPAATDERIDVLASCKLDAGHASTVDQAISQLHAAGISFDEEIVRQNLRCPLCGCPVLTGWR